MTTATSLPTPFPIPSDAAGAAPAAVPEGRVALPHLGVIRASGADAATFLQGQLSNDVLLLAPGQARLAAYCSPKGRVLASFVVYKQPGAEGAPPDLLLVCPRDGLAATLKRLSMFVLRAKARLTDASDQIAVYGAVGGAQADAGAEDPALAGLGEPPWSASVPPSPEQPGILAAIRLHPAAGQSRALLLADAATPPGPAGSLDLAAWLWLDTLAGVPLVAPAVTDQFVPQMLNYESTGGVSFKKGCYPGQEVVARSQFRGTLKRRLYVARSPVPLQAGQDVLHGPDAAQATGLVVQAAPVPEAAPGQATPAWVAAVSVQTAAAESAEGLWVLDAQGQPVALQLLERPYTLLEDI
ncbi:MAG: folate-binding protein [Comamonas sp.]